MASKKSRNDKQKKNRPRNKSNNKNRYFIALGIALFGFLLYTNTLSHGYVLDDFTQIKENYVTKQGLRGIATQWKSHARHGNDPSPSELYRPIPMTMFSLEWEIAPDTPSLSHFINVLLYALTGAILFLTLARIWKKYNLLFPLLTTLFFMAHPVHVEVVANIKSRDEIVMFLMCILTLNFLWQFLEREKIKWIIGAYLSYMIALFSKENAVTFLAIFPLFIYFFSDKRLIPTLKWLSPFVILALIFIFIRSNVIGAFDNPVAISVLDNCLVSTTDRGTQIAGAFFILGKYLWTLILPHPLCSDYGYNHFPLNGFGDWRTLLSMVVWLALGVFALLKLKQKNIWSFIILFFLINFSIFSNLIITIGTSYGDRLLFAASPAFAMALAYFLIKVFKEKEFPNDSNYKISNLFSNKKIWMAAIVILALYSFKTIDRNKAWESSYSLYHADINTAPNSAKLNFHYGYELFEKGMDAGSPEERKPLLQNAEFHFRKAIEIYQAYPVAYAYLGLIYFLNKKYDEAIQYYTAALKHRPQYALVHSNLGTLYTDTGNLAKAKEMYEIAVQEDPRMVDALQNLGAINANQGNFQEAIKWFAQGLQYDPNNPLLNRFLGSAYRDAGLPEKGQPYLEKAERLEKGN